MSSAFPDASASASPPPSGSSWALAVARPGPIQAEAEQQRDGAHPAATGRRHQMRDSPAGAARHPATPHAFGPLRASVSSLANPAAPDNIRRSDSAPPGPDPLRSGSAPGAFVRDPPPWRHMSEDGWARGGSKVGENRVTRPPRLARPPAAFTSPQSTFGRTGPLSNAVQANPLVPGRLLRGKLPGAAPGWRLTFPRVLREARDRRSAELDRSDPGWGVRMTSRLTPTGDGRPRSRAGLCAEIAIQRSATAIEKARKGTRRTRSVVPTEPNGIKPS